MQRQADAYFLMPAATRRCVRQAAARSAAAVYAGARPPAPSTPGRIWPLTYDGAILRLYVNGTQVATRAATGTIQTTPTRCGSAATSPTANFQGLIDEVRVYNRGLTQADIQTDMNPRSRGPACPPSSSDEAIARAGREATRPPPPIARAFFSSRLQARWLSPAQPAGGSAWTPGRTTTWLSGLSAGLEVLRTLDHRQECSPPGP